MDVFRGLGKNIQLFLKGARFSFSKASEKEKAVPIGTRESQGNNLFRGTWPVLLVLGFFGVAGFTLHGSILESWKSLQERARAGKEIHSVIQFIKGRVPQSDPKTLTIGQQSPRELPHSKVMFTHLSGDRYEIYRQNGDIYMRRTSKAGSTATMVLARNIRDLSFSILKEKAGPILSTSLAVDFPGESGAKKGLHVYVQKTPLRKSPSS